MIDYDQLIINVPAREIWDEKNECFRKTKAQTLTLKHSLISLSRWESKWHKPFLEKNQKSEEEIRDYIRCMTLTQNVDPNVYYCLTEDNIREIQEYIDNPMTATTIRKTNTKTVGHEIITAELIYYWMIGFQIPAEYAKWHLNKLLMLIEVCDVKNTPPKKRSKNEILSHNAALNEMRRKQLHTKG